MTQVNTENKETKPQQKNENAFVNLLVNIIIPTVIMTKYSKPEYLGQVYGLVTALAFPLLYGLYDLVNRSKVNFFSAIGLFSIVITGGIGLLELDRTWMIVKETAIPAIMGIAVIISQKTKMPLLRAFLGQIMDLDMVKKAFEDNDKTEVFEGTLAKATYLLGGTFFISAVLNFALATYILEGQPGSTEFVESLGKMTFLSFPVISVPMMIMVGFIMWNLFKIIKKETNLEIEDILNQ